MDHRAGSFWMQLRDQYDKIEEATISDAAAAAAAAADDDATDGGGGGPKEGGSTNSKFEQVVFDPSQFSLCYGRPSGGSGALTLGGSDKFLHLTPMTYAMNVSPEGGWYAVRIKAIFLRSNHDDRRQYVRVQANEDALNGSPDDGKGVIVDSGTTDTYLPLVLDQPFKAAWKQVLGGGDGEAVGVKDYDNNPTYMTAEEVNSLPEIVVVLRGHEPSNTNVKIGDAIGLASSHAEMSTQLPPNNNGSPSDLPIIADTDVVVIVPPTHYMEESMLHPGRYAARFYLTERTGSQPILGSNFIMGHDVHFDNGQGNRIGFAESDCDYSNYLEKSNNVL
jgi:hypothetical protein